MIAICDAERGCKQTFNIEKLETAKVRGDIEKTYFTCPNCKLDYVAFYTNKEIRKMQKKLRNTKSQYAINELRRKIKLKMDELKQHEQKSIKAM